VARILRNIENRIEDEGYVNVIGKQQTTMSKWCYCHDSSNKNGYQSVISKPIYIIKYESIT